MEVKKTEVIRYVLGGDPANKAMIEKIDTILSKNDVDGIYIAIEPNQQVRARKGKKSLHKTEKSAKFAQN